MRNIKCVISYDGSAFNGWQLQTSGRTVQGEIECALGVLLGEPVRVNAAGRTDAGVHALGQVINFSTGASIPVHGLLRGLNSILPGDVSVLSAEEARPGFHARYSARGKTYVYVVDTNPARNPLLRNYACRVGAPLDTDAMDAAARLVCGEHDFRSFMGAGSTVKGTVRNVWVSRVVARGAMVYLYMRGSGFLRHIVRNIAGTLILVGRGKIGPEDVRSILDRGDRRLAGPTAPPQGLYLVDVTY